MFVSWYNFTMDLTLKVFLKCFRNGLYIGIKFYNGYSTFILQSITINFYNEFFNLNLKCFVLSHQTSQIAFTLSTLLAMTCGHPSASGWQDNNVPSSSEKSGWQDENSGWKSGNSGWQSESSGWKSGNSGWDDGSSHNFYDGSVSNDYVSRYIFVVIRFQRLIILIYLYLNCFKVMEFCY